MSLVESHYLHQKSTRYPHERPQKMLTSFSGGNGGPLDVHGTRPTIRPESSFQQDIPLYYSRSQLPSQGPSANDSLGSSTLTGLGTSHRGRQHFGGAQPAGRVGNTGGNATNNINNNNINSGNGNSTPQRLGFLFNSANAWAGLADAARLDAARGLASAETRLDNLLFAIVTQVDPASAQARFAQMHRQQNMQVMTPGTSAAHGAPNMANLGTGAVGIASFPIREPSRTEGGLEGQDSTPRGPRMALSRETAARRGHLGAFAMSTPVQQQLSFLDAGVEVEDMTTSGVSISSDVVVTPDLRTATGDNFLLDSPSLQFGAPRIPRGEPTATAQVPANVAPLNQLQSQVEGELSNSTVTERISMRRYRTDSGAPTISGSSSTNDISVIGVVHGLTPGERTPPINNGTGSSPRNNNNNSNDDELMGLLYTRNGARIGGSLASGGRGRSEVNSPSLQFNFDSSHSSSMISATSGGDPSDNDTSILATRMQRIGGTAEEGGNVHNSHNVDSNNSEILFMSSPTTTGQSGSQQQRVRTSQTTARDIFGSDLDEADQDDVDMAVDDSD